MDWSLIIIACICLSLGLIGCIVPMIPGPPIAYVGMLCLHFTDAVQFSITELIIWGVLIAITVVLDYVIPSLGSKYFGGSKWGTWGCIIGTIIGLFIMPVGIILGPFLGAVIGELLGNRGYGDALKSGIGSLAGFIFGTALKVALCIYFIYKAIESLVLNL